VKLVKEFMPSELRTSAEASEKLLECCTGARRSRRAAGGGSGSVRMRRLVRRLRARKPAGAARRL
jgi:hypothetical protein